MQKRKFKIGDKVRVIKQDNHDWNTTMNACVFHEGIIEDYYGDGPNYGGDYGYEIVFSFPNSVFRSWTIRERVLELYKELFFEE